MDVDGDVILGHNVNQNVLVNGDMVVQGNLAFRSNSVLNLTATTIIADSYPSAHYIQNITVGNLQVSNVLFDQARIELMGTAMIIGAEFLEGGGLTVRYPKTTAKKTPHFNPKSPQPKQLLTNT